MTDTTIAHHGTADPAHEAAHPASLPRRHYGDLDGFRAIAAIAIVVMHVFVRGEYAGHGASSSIRSAVSPLGTFVTLFFVISGFGLCCGYYERIANARITPERFYAKRIRKLLPFFALLVLLDVIGSGGTSSLWEAFADLTMMFNLLPDLNIEVIGVGWALGVIFLFYFLFPFFVYLIGTKRRAWLTFLVSVALSMSCVFHFHKANGGLDDRRFIYHAMFFVAGGLLFLYRERIESMTRTGRVATLLVALAVLPLLYVRTPAWSSNLRQLALWLPWMILAIGADHRVFDNPIARFLSNISFEIYLSHLFIFQVCDILHLTHVTGNATADYLITLTLTLIGVTLFALAAKKAIDKGWELLDARRRNLRGPSTSPAGE